VSLQRVLLVPTTGGDTGSAAPRRGLVLTAPDAEARARAEQIGLPVLVCPELAASPDDVSEVRRRYRLDALIRGHAVADRWRDLVVVADAETLAAAAAGLCGDLSAVPAAQGDGGVITVGLPRGSRPVSWAPVVAGAVAVALLVGLTLERLYPAWLPAIVAGAGLLVLPWARTRRVGWTLLSVAGLSAVLVFVAVAGATRFPVE
jgi:hypothetical protein